MMWSCVCVCVRVFTAVEMYDRQVDCTGAHTHETSTLTLASIGKWMHCSVSGWMHHELLLLLVPFDVLIKPTGA